MKHPFISCFLLFLLVASCTAPAPEPSLTLEGSDTHSIPAEGGTVSLSFSTNH